MSSLVASLLALSCAIALGALVFWKMYLTDDWQDEAAHDKGRWYGGILYVNPEDDRYLVPHRMGLGWTVNLAHPWAVVISLLTLVVIISLVVALRAGG